jgi:NAD(P)-dependent dehydrogenase (short-subunit alcohol dehydrogenase family)
MTDGSDRRRPYERGGHDVTENSRHGAAARAGLRLDDRVVLVTGGGRGIGAEAARLLADMGAHVVVVDNGVSVEGNPEEPSVAETVVAGITGAGGSAAAVTCDAADYDAVGDVVHEIVRDHGNLYGVVAAA